MLYVKIYLNKAGKNKTIFHDDNNKTEAESWYGSSLVGNGRYRQ